VGVDRGIPTTQSQISNVINFVTMETITTDAAGNDLITAGVEDHEWGKPPIVKFCDKPTTRGLPPPVVYGLALSTPAHAVDRLAADLTRYTDASAPVGGPTPPAPRRS
jgi:hypothetical protein